MKSLNELEELAKEYTFKNNKVQNHQTSLIEKAFIAGYDKAMRSYSIEIKALIEKEQRSAALAADRKILYETAYNYLKELGEKNRKMVDPEKIVFDEKKLIDFWYARNPSHDLKFDTNEDMYWGTVFMVFKDYLKSEIKNV